MSDLYPLLAEPSMETHNGFILAEEAALKDHLTGIHVPAAPGSKPGAAAIKVPVWYRFPEGERQLRYPFIIIDMITVEPAFDLFHSEHFYDPNKLSEDGRSLYRPSFSTTIPPPPSGEVQWVVRNYLPFRITFQVTTFARSNLHDRYLTSIFMTDIFPVRPFWIRCAADDTYRRTETLGMQQMNQSETTESGTKRIFRKAWTVSMQAEIPQNRFTEEGGDWAYTTFRLYIPVVQRAMVDSYFEKFLDGQPDPLNDFTTEERAAGGELFHILTTEDPPSP
jgi:hypothetical protein